MAAIECAHDAQVDTVSLVPNPRNPNKHPARQIELLAKIIKHTGWRNPIVVSNRSGFIVKGHARLEAAKLLGETQVPVDYQDYPNEAMEWADMVADNRIAELAEPSLPELKDILQELDTGAFDMDLTGFDSKALEELMTQTFQPKNGLTDDDEIPEPKETICKAGDLWLLGRHRLLCGDSTKPEDVARLMGGEKADITFTSPPYNVGKNSVLSPHQKSGTKYVDDDDNKSSDEYLRFLSDCVANALDNSAFVFLNVQSLAGNKSVLIDLLYNLKSLYADTLIWDKQNAQPAMAKNVCNSQFEYIHVFSEKATRAIGSREFRGTVSNVISIHKKSSEIAEHNATFPVALAEFIIREFSSKCVLDPFLGSGTTLIACEKLNRRCFGMEIDPHYCDVVVERWQNYTGQKAQRG